MATSITDWQLRADALGIRAPLLARITGKSPHTVRAYRQGKFNPSPEWLEKVDNFLTSIELAGRNAA